MNTTKPMLQAIGNDELQKSFRNTLKAFYGALKSKDGCIKFGILTGVTKFGKVSVFSDLNNLDDISMWNQYIDICGISEQELHDNLEVEIHEMAEIMCMAYEGITVDALNNIDLTPNHPIPMMYQNSYLTIKGYDDKFEIYQLGLPNHEVEEGFRNIEKWIVE